MSEDFQRELEDGFIRDEASAVQVAFDTGNNFKLWELMANWRQNPTREQEVMKRVGEEVFLAVQNSWIEEALDNASKPSNIVFPPDIQAHNLRGNEEYMQYLSEKLNANKKKLKEIQEARNRPR